MSNNAKNDIERLEAPYKLPEGWKWQIACDIANVYTGNSINEKVKSEKYEGQTEGLNFIGTKDIDFDGSINYANGVKINDFENFKTAPANTPLLCIEGGSSGKKLGFTNEQVCFGNKLCAFVSKEVEPKLIYYYLQTNFFYHSFMKERHGLIGGVSVGSIKQIPFPLPQNLTEQQRIVNCIESMFAKLDEAKEKAQNVVDSFETRKAAILHQAFTGNLTAKWRKENDVLDDSWEEKTIGECVKLYNGDRGKNYPNKNEYVLEGIPWINTGHITETGYLNRETMNYITVDKYNLLRSGKISQGDMVFCLRGATFGKIARVEPFEKGAIASSLVIIRPKKEVNREYIFLYLRSPFAKKELNKYANGSAQPNLAAKDLAKYRIPIPSFLEQQEIVRILDTVLEKESIAKNTAEQVLEQIDLLKKSILARAFRGEL